MPAERFPRAGRRPSRLAGLVVVALLLGLAGWSVLALQPPARTTACRPSCVSSTRRKRRVVLPLPMPPSGV